MSGSPFIHQDIVIVDAGGSSNKAVIAYDRSSGEIAWATENHQAGYATPRIETVNGVDQLLIFHGDGLLAVDPDDGTRFWEYPWTNMYKINVAQPIRQGDRIFLSSGYDAGCVLIDPTQLTNGIPAEVWPPNNNLKLKFNEAVKYNGYIYGLDDGILCCIDLQTGERQWKGGRYRFGQVLLWEDKLIVSAEKGYVAVVQATPAAHRELSRLQVLNDRTWNMHVVNRGRLYVRNAWEAACLELQPAAGETADSTDEQP
jgi:outer membrane protein assembly factor BamB